MALAYSRGGSSSSTTLDSMLLASRMSSTSWAMPYPSGASSVKSQTSPSSSSLEFWLRVPSAMFLAGVSLSVVARAARLHLSMTWSHRSIKHGCSVNYVGFSQRQTTISMQLSFSRHCTCKVALQGPQSVVCYANNRRKFKKVIGGLRDLCYHKETLNSTKLWLFRCLRSDGYK
jgi:hypothetical protein